MRRLFLLLLVYIALAIFMSACTDIQTMNLSVTYENVTKENLTYVSDVEVPEKAAEITEKAAEEPAMIEEAPMVIEEQAYVAVDPEKLVKKLCPEQVLLGLRSCKSVDNGDINITIKNAGFRNITMIFYFYYEDELMTYVYDGEPFLEKEEKTYTIDFDTIEKEYGEMTKIEATPVLIEGLEAISCQNKKLPVIVSSGCS